MSTENAKPKTDAEPKTRRISGDNVNEPNPVNVKVKNDVDVKESNTHKLKLGLHKLNDSVKLPKFGTEDSACFDLYTHLKPNDEVTIYTPHNIKHTRKVESRGLIIHSGERALIPTGIIFDIPKGYELKLFPRSSVAVKLGLNLINCTAIIDSDYVQELFIAIYNNSQQTQFIENDIRLAQAQLNKLVEFEFVEINSAPSQKTSRSGGCGSTGSK